MVIGIRVREVVTDGLEVSVVHMGLFEHDDVVVRYLRVIFFAVERCEAVDTLVGWGCEGAWWRAWRSGAGAEAREDERRGDGDAHCGCLLCSSIQ